MLLDSPKTTCLLFIVLLSMSAVASAKDYDLPKLARMKTLKPVGRALDQPNKDLPEAVFLTAGPGDGFAWINGLEFTEGTIEIEIKGKDQPGRSFVGLAFHAKDDESFDAVYVRPFNFQSKQKGSNSLQYVSMQKKRLGQTSEGSSRKV